MSTDQAPQRRAYSSPRRQQQAAENRAAVVAAAIQLFGDRGFVATGMKDVAGEAGLSLETVYANFRSKSDLLLAAIDVAVVDDAEPVPLRQRPEFSALGRGGSEQRARAAARMVTGIHRRTAGVILALREAAASDAALARLMREREDGRRADVERGIALVAGRPVSAEECDGLWAVLDVGVYRLLTDMRGWTSHQYELWVADLIARQLRDAGRQT